MASVSSTPRTAVCVLGFHRSGTSMTTRLLNLLGVELGGDLLPADHDNPRGFWEPRWMVRLNDEILAAVGADYMRPPRDDAPWSELHALEARAGALLDQHFGELSLFGFKDPRLCLTWPFWKHLVADRVDEIRYVVCVRSPAETAASMVGRGRYPGVAHADWGRLWLDYTGRALAAARGARRAVVFYDDLISGGIREARSLAEHLALGWPVGERAAELESSIDDSMRHHAASIDDTVRDDRLPSNARAAYASLRAAAAARKHGDVDLAEALERSVEALWRDLRTDDERADALAVHREAIVDAIAEVQRGERREDRLLEQLARSREQLVQLDAELAQARADRRGPLDDRSTSAARARS